MPQPSSQNAKLLPRATEWRTPPLWGFHDSGPYLHDGRAASLDKAVQLHEGQGAESNQRYHDLRPDERGKIQAFLESLVAPPLRD